MKKTFKGVLGKVVSVALSAAMLISVCPQSSMAADDYNVVWIGGSFTEGTTGGGTRFTTLVTQWMNENNYAAGKTVVEKNVAIGGTTSGYGAIRFDDDALSKNPDMLIIEFAGNDSSNSATFDYSNAATGMEMMIRKTIAANPKTKIAVLFRPSWNGNVGAKTIHKLIADYYNVPIITADEVETKSEWVQSDGVHPNAEGNKAIAEYIENWLSENEFNAPTWRQFPMNYTYKAVMPVKKSIKDFIDTEKSTDYTENEDGSITVPTDKNLYLKVKGSIFGIMGTGESNSSSGTYIVDPYSVNASNPIYDQGSRNRGYFNSAATNRVQVVDLNIGEGEHEIQISVGTQKGDAVFKDIYVDACANYDETPYETLSCESFYDDINSMSGSYITKTTGGASVSYYNYNYITGLGDGRGLQNYSQGVLTYTLPENKVVRSVMLKTIQTSTTTPYEFYAVNAAGEETKLETQKLVTDAGEGGIVENGRQTVETFTTTSLPEGTAKIKLKQVIDGYAAANILGVGYLYGDATLESVTIEAAAQMLEGEKVNATVKGVYSDGSKVAFGEDADIIYSTGNSSVASVNSLTGEITAKGAGTATIFADVTVGEKEYQASAKVTVYAKNNISEAYFEVAKTNYITGTSGKIDFVTTIEGVTEKNAFEAKYTSSDPHIVKVNADGSFEAVSAGTAQINVSVTALQDTFEPITINVYDSNDVKSYLKADVDAGLLDEKMLDMTSNNSHRGIKHSTLRHGTKLYTLARNGQFPAFDGDYLYHFSGGAEDNSIMGFVYEIDEGLESVTADIFTLTASLTNRVKIAYLTDDTFECYDAVYNKNIQFGSDLLTGYGSPSGAFEKAENGAYKVNSHWTVDDTATKKDIDGNVKHYTSTNIPEGAKYVMVVVQNGKLEDDTAAMTAWNISFAGVELKYAKKLAAGEVTDDGKVALTYNADMENPALTVTVNGAAVENPTVTYDEETFTSYVDLDLKENDSVKIEIAGLTDTFESTIADKREQVVSIGLKDSDGADITELPMDSASVTVTAKVANTKEEKVNIVAALYRDGKMLKAAMPEGKQSSVTNGSADVEFKFDFGTTAQTGDVLKVFCWKANLSPFDNFTGAQSVFETEDF